MQQLLLLPPIAGKGYTGTAQHSKAQYNTAQHSTTGQAVI